MIKIEGAAADKAGLCRVLGQRMPMRDFRIGAMGLRTARRGRRRPLGGAPFARARRPGPLGRRIGLRLRGHSQSTNITRSATTRITGSTGFTAASGFSSSMSLSNVFRTEPVSDRNERMPRRDRNLCGILSLQTSKSRQTHVGLRERAKVQGGEKAEYASNPDLAIT